MVELLKEYRDCFAWDYDKLKGLERSLVEHKLPIKPGRDGTFGIGFGRGILCLTLVVALGILVLGGELSTTPLPVKRFKSN